MKRKPKKRQTTKGWRCHYCKLVRKESHGPDPCLGYLPGVLFACCGHGGKHEGNGVNGYVMFENGLTIRFPFCRVDGITE